MDRTENLKDVPLSPENWYIVFKTKTPREWLNRVPFLRFRHVMCFGYVAAADTWVFFDTSLTNAATALVPNAAVTPYIDWVCMDAGVLKMPAGERTHYSPFGRICTAQVALICGIRCCALRPGALWRHCLRNNAEIIQEPPGHGRRTFWQKAKDYAAGQIARGAASLGKGRKNQGSPRHSPARHE